MADLEDHLPLKPVDLHVLLVLTDGACHGYGIVKAIAERTDGSLRLEPGNLYRYVRRLVEIGAVERADRRAAEGDERRRYYRVTSWGRRLLAAEAERMRVLAAAVDAGLAG